MTEWGTPDPDLSLGAESLPLVGESLAEIQPDIQLGTPPPPKRISVRKRLVVVGVAVSVMAAFGVVAAGAFNRQDAVRSALASVFASPTLKVVFTAQTSDPSSSATVAEYSVALTVTSENGSEPLSGYDGVDNFEISVYRSGVDIADLLVSDGAVYARVDLQAIDPSEYSQATQSLNSHLQSGPAYDLASAALDDQWVGVDQSVLGSLTKSMGVKTKEPSFATSRNDIALSFSQSWDLWASIHQVSSTSGTTEYSVNVPVRNFVASFTQRLESAVAKQVPSVKPELGLYASLVRTIPAGLEIPLTMWVSNGSMTQLQVSFKGDSLDLAISHPSVGVTAPAGAVMATTGSVQALENAYGTCATQSSPGGITPPTICEPGGLDFGGLGAFGGIVGTANHSCTTVVHSEPPGSPSGVPFTTCGPGPVVAASPATTVVPSEVSGGSGSG